MNTHNFQNLPDFDGISPNQMHELLYFLYGQDSPVSFLPLADADFKSMPLFNLVSYLTHLIKEAGELKLTKKGFVLRKDSIDCYQQGFFISEHIESGLFKISKEADFIPLEVARNLLELSGIVKKRKNKLSLTVKGLKIINNKQQFLMKIFKTYGQILNWAYFDRYDNEKIGQIGLGFTLMLLSQYGSTNKTGDFYAKKYFSAFPILKQQLPDSEYQPNKAEMCYIRRTFDCFLSQFGLVEITKDRQLEYALKEIKTEYFLKKTTLFDKFIHCKSPT